MIVSQLFRYIYFSKAMEKMISTINMEYESINDRILRLRKDANSLNRTKERMSAVLTGSQQRLDRVERNQKILDMSKNSNDCSGSSSRYEPPTAFKIDYNNISIQSLNSLSSPRRYGISRRTNFKYENEELKKVKDKDKETKEDSKLAILNRVPGKICKNGVSRLYSIGTNSAVKFFSRS